VLNCLLKLNKLDHLGAHRFPVNRVLWYLYIKWRAVLVKLDTACFAYFACSVYLFVFLCHRVIFGIHSWVYYSLFIEFLVRMIIRVTGCWPTATQRSYIIVCRLISVFRFILPSRTDSFNCSYVRMTMMVLNLLLLTWIRMCEFMRLNLGQLVILNLHNVSRFSTPGIPVKENVPVDLSVWTCR